MSDNGTDNNDCHSASAPCKNLQTVLDRATDDADIYVTSDTLSLDFHRQQCEFPGQEQYYSFSVEYPAEHAPVSCCVVNSNLTYNLNGFHGMVAITCEGS